MTEVIWHLGDSWWDTALPKYVLANAGATKHTVGIENLAPTEKIAVLMIPGRHSLKDYDDLNRCAAKFEKVIFYIYGDEEGCLHADWLKHPNKIIWWAMPPFAPKQKIERVTVNGWPTDCPEMLDDIGPQRRTLDWFFSGQMTHARRVECVNGLQGIPNGVCNVTMSFTAGLPRVEYYELMRKAKMIPCPAGPCTPDSFRFAEAMEAGCIPIADAKIQHDWYPEGYFQYALGTDELPFPVVSDWSTLPDVMDEWLVDWELKADRCQRWWTSKKQSLVNQMIEDLEQGK